MRHLNTVRKPDGRVLTYYRPKGCKAVRLPDLPHDHPDFLAAYARAAGTAETPRSPVVTGTLAAAIIAWQASDDFLSRAPATRANWRRQLGDIAQRYGRARMVDLKARHIEADLSRLTAHAANNRLKIWRGAARWWVQSGLIAENPAKSVERRKLPRSEGHIPWTREDVARFRKKWEYGTAERLAFELIFWTGARISDALRLGPGMIDRSGWLCYRQQKTGGDVAVPMSAEAPSFAEPDDHLSRAIAAQPVKHMTWMVTAAGKPRSVKAAPSWLADAAEAAGIEPVIERGRTKRKSAHGLRKLRLTIMAENGATTHQLAAWAGHDSLSEVQHYSRAAERRKVLSGPERERKSSNGPKPSSNAASEA